MKKVVSVILTIIIFCCSISVYCEGAKKRPAIAIYTDLLPLILGYLNLHGEVAIGNKVSLVGGLGYMSFRVLPESYRIILSALLGTTLPNRRITIVSYKIGLSFYFLGQSLKGLYISPTLIQTRITATNEPPGPDDPTLSDWSTIGMELGLRGVLLKHVLFGSNIGLGIAREIKPKDGAVLAMPYVGIQFGFAW